MKSAHVFCLLLAAAACTPSASTQTDGAAPVLDAGNGVCDPADDHTCNDQASASSLWGQCQLNATCNCLPGYVVNPLTGRCRPGNADAGPVTLDAGLPVQDAGVERDASVVVRDAGVMVRDAGVVSSDGGAFRCTPGQDQTCNDSPTVSSFQGTCPASGHCNCNPGNYLNPFSGRCRNAVQECQSRGGECTQTDTDTGPCPPGTYSPFYPDLSSCFTNVPRACCIPEGNLGSSCSANSCTDGACLTEASGYPVGGVCTRPCDSDASCSPWAICQWVPFSAAPGMCLLPCTSNEMCREGWSCQPMPRQPFLSGGETTNVCWKSSMEAPKSLGAGCMLDSECLSATCKYDPGAPYPMCSAPCSDDSPCLRGYSCQAGWCFPA